MKISKIICRGYDYAKEKWVLCAQVKNMAAFSGYEYKMFLFLTHDECYAVKEGDILS